MASIVGVQRITTTRRNHNILCSEEFLFLLGGVCFWLAAVLSLLEWYTTTTDDDPIIILQNLEFLFRTNSNQHHHDIAAAAEERISRIANILGMVGALCYVLDFAVQTVELWGGRYSRCCLPSMAASWRQAGRSFVNPNNHNVDDADDANSIENNNTSKAPHWNIWALWFTFGVGALGEGTAMILYNGYYANVNANAMLRVANTMERVALHSYLLHSILVLLLLEGGGSVPLSSSTVETSIVPRDQRRRGTNWVIPSAETAASPRYEPQYAAASFCNRNPHPPALTILASDGHETPDLFHTFSVNDNDDDDDDDDDGTDHNEGHSCTDYCEVDVLDDNVSMGTASSTNTTSDSLSPSHDSNNSDPDNDQSSGNFYCCCCCFGSSGSAFHFWTLVLGRGLFFVGSLLDVVWSYWYTSGPSSSTTTTSIGVGIGGDSIINGDDVYDDPGYTAAMAHDDWIVDVGNLVSCSMWLIYAVLTIILAMVPMTSGPLSARRETSWSVVYSPSPELSG